MKRTVIVIVIFTLGLSALSYPLVANYFARKNGSKLIQEYSEKVSQTDRQKLDEMWAQAEKYNENLTGVPVHDPFLEGSGMAMPQSYTDTLNLKGFMGYVEIPKIEVYLPIYHGTSEATLSRGIGHLEGSTLPIGGRSRHSVITGHSGLVNAKMFTDITELRENDLFYIHVLGEHLAYKVDQIKIIEPNVTEDLLRFEGKDYVTLLTCTPYGINTHRLLVRGERVPYDEAAKEAIKTVGMSQADALVLKAAILTTTVMILVAVLITVLNKKQERKKADSGKPTGNKAQ